MFLLAQGTWLLHDGDNVKDPTPPHPPYNADTALIAEDVASAEEVLRQWRWQGRQNSAVADGLGQPWLLPPSKQKQPVESLIGIIQLYLFLGNKS